MFRKLILALAVTGAAALPIVDSAEAAVGEGVVSGGTPSMVIAPIEKTQYVYGGRNFCWYPGGWRGPGWYWCGYAYRAGFGWGGGPGWRGWGGGPGWRGPGWRGPGWRGPGWGGPGPHRHW